MTSVSNDFYTQSHPQLPQLPQLPQSSLVPFVDRLAAIKWVLQSLYSVSRSELRQCAAVLDIDDTTIAFDMSRTVVIHPTLILFQSLRHLGLPVFFITARSYSPEAQVATEQQLYEAGFGEHAGLFLMPEEYERTFIGVASFKTDARKYIKQTLGRSIILNVGNAWTDLLPPFVVDAYEDSFNPNQTYVGTRNGWVIKYPHHFLLDVITN